MEIKNLLRITVEKDASDLFLKAGYPPYLRIKGAVLQIDSEPVDASGLNSMVSAIINPSQMETFKKNKELDFILDVQDVGRFRGNIGFERQSIFLVFRYVKNYIRSFSELNLPTKIFEKLSYQTRGLVLLTGAIGSGKSTTIASMIEYINQYKHKHILTIEEPIEYVFTNAKSIITQREIGFDTSSYDEALRHGVYQSPDILFIGAIRDAKTMATAINAAETGQLVLSTIHSINAPQTVERIMNFFPQYQHDEIRMQLSLLLRGVISLRLMPMADGQGRIPAAEIMLWTPTISSLIREGKINQLNQFIESGNFLGMQSFNQALVKLYFAKKITLETAREFADNPEELDLFIKGVKKLDGTIQ